MDWFFYALMCALFLATSDTFAKKTLRNVNEYIVAWGRLVWAAPFVIIVFPFISVPPVKPAFWTALCVLYPLEITAIILYIKAIKRSPLSITVPFLGLTPLFLILTSYVVLDESVDSSGIIGIVLVASGAYCLNLGKTKAGLLGPIRAVYKEKGSFMMVMVAAIYSISAVLGKVCAQNSSPLFFCLFYVLTLPVVLFPIVITNTSKRDLKTAFTTTSFVFIGLFYGLSIMCHLTAIVRVEVPYMISVKRMSLLFGIIYGRFVFKEKKFTERLAGGLLIVAGITCITLL